MHSKCMCKWYEAKKPLRKKIKLRIDKNERIDIIKILKSMIVIVYAVVTLSPGYRTAVRV